MLASLYEDKGRMGIVLDQGALFRGGAEGKIRKAVLREDMIECVVALPEKLFYNTGAPGCLIFLNKAKPEERKGKVLFIYAAEEYSKLSNMNQLQPEHIQRIVDTYHDYVDSDKYSRVVELSEVKENDYNLSVTRYVDIFDPPEPIDIQQVWNNLKTNKDKKPQLNSKPTSRSSDMKTEYPVQWRIRELGKLCSKPQYGYTVSASMDKIGPKLLRITDITDGKLDWDKVPYCKCTDEDFSKYQLEKGDLLFARTGSTGSSILIEETPPPSVFASYLIRLKILDEISSQYLKQYFQSFDYWKQIERLKVGAVQSGINASVLYSLKVPVPPLVEQRGIAEVLGTVDTAIRVQEQIIAETESLKQGLMQQLLTKGIGHTEYKQTPIGQIPKTWDVIKYEKANKRIFVGIATSTTQYMVEYGIPLIRNQNIKEGKIDLSDLVYISKEFAKSNKSKTIKENDVLTVRTGYTGQSCKVEKEMDGWQTFTTIISRPKLDQYESDFIVHLLNSPLVRNRIQKLEAGLAQKNLNVGWISNLLIPKPPLNEQKRISKIIKDVYSDIEELEKGKTRLHFIKNGLMQVLLSGERRVELREDRLHRV